VVADVGHAGNGNFFNNIDVDKDLKEDKKI